MVQALFALAHSEFGVSRFTTDLIALSSSLLLLSLPFALLRPHLREIWSSGKVLSGK